MSQILTVFILLLASGPSREEASWPRFRGSGGLAICPHSDIPTSFDGKTGKNILWKVPVPLEGESSPVVWGKKVFLTGGNREKREVFCFDADSGKLNWQRPVKTVRRAPTNPEEEDDEDAEILYAAATPATDGKRVMAIFGTGDVACLDLEGNQIWSRSLGRPENAYGHASSLEIWRNLLLIQLDQASLEDGKSRLMAVNVLSGKTVWNTRRPVPSSWTTPIAIEVGGPGPRRPQIITSADPWVISYNPATGDEIWRAECQAGEVVPSPIFAEGLVIAASTDGILAAIRPDGKGDVTKTHIVWSSEDDLPSTTSPVSNGRLLFLLGPGGFLTCYRVQDGKKVWEKDLESHFQASPSLAGDLLYLPCEEGTFFILRVGETCEVVAKPGLDEKCLASPAFAPGRMYIRTEKHLWAIGGK